MVIKKIYFKIKNLFADLFLQIIIGDFPASVKILSPRQTLNKCKEIISNKISGAYLRFGDGDVNLLNGEDELMQKSNEKLKAEMKETFSLTGDGVVKGLMIHSRRFGLCPGMRLGVHLTDDKWAAKFLRKCYKYFIGDKIYSHVALSYAAVFERDYAVDFLRFLKSSEPIFICNEKVEPSIAVKLFGSNIFIGTPATGSYSKIDEIERLSLKAIDESKKDFVVMVVAMGCSGRVLQKRILQNSKKKVFLFDFGSLLDAFCGWNTRAWIELSNLPDDYFKKLLDEI